MTMDQNSGEGSLMVHCDRDGFFRRLPARIWECLGTARFSTAFGLNDWRLGGTGRAAPADGVYRRRCRFNQLTSSLIFSKTAHLELVKQPVIQHA